MLFVVEEFWAGCKRSVFCDKRLSVAMQYITLNPEMQCVRVYKETKNNKVQVWPNPTISKAISKAITAAGEALNAVPVVPVP